MEYYSRPSQLPIGTILIIVLAVGFVLWQTGLLPVEKFVPQKCEISKHMICSNYYVKENYVYLYIATQSTEELRNVDISLSQGRCVGHNQETLSIENPVSVKMNCTQLPVPGEVFISDIIIRYQAASEIVHTERGSLRVAIEE